MFADRLKIDTASFLCGLFLICMCGLMLQIVETRILSVIAYYHLAFFAISMAMLGMTAGSLLVYFRRDWFRRERLFQRLTCISSALAIALFLSTIILTTTVIGTGKDNTWLMTAVVWLKLILVLLPPYVFAGMAISLALTRSSMPVGLVYGVDLLGASAGCLLILLLLEWADAISLLIGIAALAALASVCFQRAASHFERNDLKPAIRGFHLRKSYPLLLTLLFGLVAVANASVQPTRPNRWSDGLVLLASKGALELETPALARWNTYSRIMVSKPAIGLPFLWGPSPIMPDNKVSQRWLNIDGAAATAMYEFDGNINKLDFLKYDITNLAYTIRHHGRSAVIGVGGGRDMLSAYLFGFRDITGVELNPIFIDLLKRDFRDYNHLADLPGVKFHVDDARSWFARTHEKFDLIEMSLVDTWAATGAGAYSLSENGLYTKEGWGHFLSALTPTGVFTVSRWFYPKDKAETGRLLSLAAAALRDKGIENPERHLFLAGSDHLATLILAKSPFTSQELTQLRARAKALQFDVLVAQDQLDRSKILTQIVLAQSPSELAHLSRQQHVDLSVSTDDRPFFFNLLNSFDPASISFGFRSADGTLHGNVLAAITLLLIATLSMILVLFAMIIPALPSVRRTRKSLAVAGSFYFFLIGIGFMFVEMGLIQRLSMFLGHPVYGLAIALFGLILSTGVGSLASEYRPLDTRTKYLAWVVALSAYLLLLPLAFPNIVTQFESQSLLVRMAVALSVIVPAGLLMGYGFPTGMRLVNAIDTEPTPWFWAVNGAAGVLAASLAVAISMGFSISASVWIGAACYVALAPVGLALLALEPNSATILQN